MERFRLRAAFAALAVLASLGVFGVGIGTAGAADEEAFKAALADYQTGAGATGEERKAAYASGLEKLRAYVDSHPTPEEALAAIRGADDALVARVMSLGGDHERLLKYLYTRARPMVEAAPADPSEIKATVEAAVNGPDQETRRSAAMKLRQYGELAVPDLYPYLGAQEEETIVHAQFAVYMLGEDATLALMEVLNSDDARLRGYVVQVLADLKDRRALPALQRLRQTDPDQGVKQKADAAMLQIGAPQALDVNAADGFTWLGERYYSGDPTIVMGFDQKQNLWRWEDGALARYEVPAYLYPYQLAEEFASKALDLQPEHAGARALLVRAILAQKVEGDVRKTVGVEVPESLARAEDVAASQGFRAASDALAASLREDDWDVAVEAAALVAKTFNGENLQNHPLGTALIAKEKRVRYAAAIAALHMTPPRGLPNADKVAALAAQAASESAVRQVLVIDDREDTRARLVMDLAHAGYVVGGAASGTEGVDRAKAAPTLDVIVVRADLGDPSRQIPQTRHLSSYAVIDELLADARTKDMRVVVLVGETMDLKVDAVQAGFQEKYKDALKGFITVPIDTASAVGTVNTAAEAGDLNADQERANRVAAIAADAFSQTDFSCTTFDLGVAVEPLSTAATEGPTPEVRMNAVKALGNIRMGGAAALVKVMREGENDDIKAAAATALGNVLGATVASVEEIGALIEASKGEGPVAAAALRALGNVKSLTPEQRHQIFRDHKLPVGAKAGSSS